MKNVLYSLFIIYLYALVTKYLPKIAPDHYYGLHFKWYGRILLFGTNPTEPEKSNCFW